MCTSSWKSSRLRTVCSIDKEEGRGNELAATEVGGKTYTPASCDKPAYLEVVLAIRHFVPRVYAVLLCLSTTTNEVYEICAVVSVINLAVIGRSQRRRENISN